MMALTVGYVSGIIALAIFVVQAIYPNLVGLLLVACLGKDHSAVTWSVAGRELQTTSWPTILRSDTSASSHVNWYVKLLGRMRLFLAALVAITAIVTPLGLHTTVRRSNEASPEVFTYVPDEGPMGKATPPRPAFGFDRVCTHDSWLPGVCPGDDLHIDFHSKNGTHSAHWNGTYDVRIPKDRAVFFQSGLDDLPSTVSSFFDIQYRQYSFASQKGANHNKPYPVGGFLPILSFTLDNDTKPIEGLIVDSQHGRIGFRNHTAPTKVELAADWKEDLLFIEPWTVCADTNLTLEFQMETQSFMTLSSYQNVQNVSLVDNGGFANLNTTYPSYIYSHTQKHPEMRFRAWKQAWYHNALLMRYFNITAPDFPYIHSKIGKRFPLKGSTLPPPNAIYIDSEIGSYLDNLPQNNVTIGLFEDANLLCQGAGGHDIANMTQIGVVCGMLWGAARPRDDEISPSPEYYRPGSWWTRPIYSCASATKATIKTVHLQWDAKSGTGLKRLKVLDIQDKQYNSSSSDMPVWAVEDTNKTLLNTALLWGLISKNYTNLKSSNYSIVRESQLILPGYSSFGLDSGTNGDFEITQSFENIPGAHVPTDALASAYNVPIYDGRYSGSANYAILLRWQELTANLSTAGKVLDLIWTDYMANALIGTRSQLPTPHLPSNLQKRGKPGRDTGGDHQARTTVPVHIYKERISYRMVFAIPAIVTLAFITALISTTVYCILRGQASPKLMDWYLTRISPGRLLGLVSGTESEAAAFSSTKEWVENIGKAPINLEKMEVNGHQSTLRAEDVAQQAALLKPAYASSEETEIK